MKTINQVEWTFLGKLHWTKNGWRLQLDLATNPLFDCDEIPEARLCWGDINSKAQDNYKKNNYMDQDNYNLDEFRHDRSCQERDSAEERVVSGMWRFPWFLDILISFQFTSCHIGFIWEGRRATMNSFFIHKLFFHSGTPLTQMRHSTLKIWLYYSPLQAKLSATRHHWDVQYICAPGLPWAPTKSRSREEDHGGSHGASRT